MSIISWGIIIDIQKGEHPHTRYHNGKIVKKIDIVSQDVVATFRNLELELS